MIQSKECEYDKKIVTYAISKLELTQEEFEEIFIWKEKPYRLSGLLFVDPAVEVPQKIACNMRLLYILMPPNTQVNTKHKDIKNH